MTEQEYNDLFSFNFVRESYALSTKGQPDKNSAVFLRCKDDSLFEPQKVKIPAPYNHDNVGPKIACESWDNLILSFNPRAEEDAIHIAVTIEEQSGSAYLGQIDDSVPRAEKSEKTLILRKQEGGLEISLCSPEGPFFTPKKFVAKKFKQ